MYALTDVEENSTASPDMHMINDKRRITKIAFESWTAMTLGWNVEK
jgi:hypothetical protein